MKKTSIIILIVSIFLILEYFYLGNIVYNFGNYSLAASLFPPTKIWTYNKANAYYKLWDYEKAKQIYLSIYWNWYNNLDYKLNHNLWNTFYRLWEKENNILKKIQLWEKAIKYYKTAIKIWEKIKVNKNDLNETKANLQFVLNKLKNLQKNKNQKQQSNNQWQNKKNQQKKQQESNNSKWNNQQNNNKSWENKNSQQNNNWTNKTNKNKQWKESNQKNWKAEQKWQTNNNQGRNQSSKQWQNNKQSNNQWTLNNNQQNQTSKWQKNIERALQQYEKMLEQKQKQNMQNYGKVYQPKWQSPFDNPFFQDIIDSDPFFEWDPFEKRNEVKDW
jgi:hypothetical protein